MLLIEELKTDLDLFYSDNKAYRAKVDGISELLGLHGKMQLRSDFLPTYIVGDYQGQRSKYVLFGMNPFFSQELNTLEEDFKGGTWERYENFIREFFQYEMRQESPSGYYKRLAKLFAGLDGIPVPAGPQLWEYYKRNVVSIDLVPYHSAGFGLPKSLSFDQGKYLNERFDSCFDFIRGIPHKLVIMNGKAFHTLLIENPRLVDLRSLRLTHRTTAYSFRFKEVPCIMFDWMITQAGSGVKDIHKSVAVPQFAKESFGDIL